MVTHILTLSLISAAWVCHAGSLPAEVISPPPQARESNQHVVAKAEPLRQTPIAKSVRAASLEPRTRQADPNAPELMAREYLAAVCQSSSASIGFSTASDTTPIPDCVIAANGAVYGVAKFSATAVNAVQGHFKLPAGFNVITLDVDTRTSADPGNVLWQLQSACVGPDESDEFTWSDPDFVNVMSPGTSGQLNTARIDPVNTPNCAAGKRFFFRFFRDPSHSADDFESAAQLISLRFVVR